MARFKSAGLVGVLWWLLAVANAGAQIFTKTDPATEVALGRLVAQEIERRYGRTKDPALEQRVSRLGARLAEQLENRLYTYEFRVLASQEINAMALPGGIIYICEGLLAHYPEDETLAFVIAHEVTHAAKRHWASFVKKSETTGLLLAIVGAATGLGDLVTLLAQAIIEASYSREQENEADAGGLELMWRAGFNPQGAVRAMRILAELAAQPKIPHFLRSHPPTEERIARLEKLCEKLAGQTPPSSRAGAPAAEDLAALYAQVGELGSLQPVFNSWFPLAVGNEWTYEVSAGSSPRTRYTLRIVSACPTPQGTVYRLEWRPGQGQPILSQILTTKEGCWRRPRPNDPACPWQLEYLLPLLPSEVTVAGWTYTPLGEETLTTPCGQFTATVIQKQGGEPPRSYRLWFAPGIGLLQRICRETNVTEQLVEYKVAPPPAAEEGATTGAAPAGATAPEASQAGSTPVAPAAAATSNAAPAETNPQTPAAGQ